MLMRALHRRLLCTDNIDSRRGAAEMTRATTRTKGIPNLSPIINESTEIEKQIYDNRPTVDGHQLIFIAPYIWALFTDLN